MVYCAIRTGHTITKATRSGERLMMLCPHGVVRRSAGEISEALGKVSRYYVSRHYVLCMMILVLCMMILCTMILCTMYDDISTMYDDISIMYDDIMYFV